MAGRDDRFGGELDDDFEIVEETEDEEDEEDDG